MKRLLPKLTERLAPIQPLASKIPVPKFSLPLPEDSTPLITHDWLWPRVGQFLQKKDVVVAETGTSSFGVLDVPFPDDAVFVSQILWGSIGWTVGEQLTTCLHRHLLNFTLDYRKHTGCCFSCERYRLKSDDPIRWRWQLVRVESLQFILFSTNITAFKYRQLTVQEISTMIRTGVKPIIFVLNNAGYTIERHLHGWERKYNDISNWKWTSLLSVFQGSTDTPKGKSYTVHTKEELDKLLSDAHFAAAEEIQLVEIMMDKFDAPPALRRQAELSGKTNAYVPGSMAGVVASTK